MNKGGGEKGVVGVHSDGKEMSSGQELKLM